MYTLLKVGKDFFWHLQGEQAIVEVIKSEKEQYEKGLLEAIREIYKENLKEIRIFIETSGLPYIAEKTMNNLMHYVNGLCWQKGEVYFSGISEEILCALQNRLVGAGYETECSYNGKSDWFLSVSAAGTAEKKLKIEKGMEIIKDIQVDNLKLLIEEGPKGKSLNVRKIIQDHEDYLYYYIYCLTQKMIEESLVSADCRMNQDVYLITENEYGYQLALELAKFLGTKVVKEADILRESHIHKEFIIVRDVIHMFCELNKLTTLLEGMNATIRGSVSLIEINTGVGKRKNKVSYYQIDLEKGIGHRIREKSLKTEETVKTDQ